MHRLGFLTATSLVFLAETAFAVDADGYFKSYEMGLSCEGLIQAYLDEQAARAKIAQPQENVTFNRSYSGYLRFIAGFMTATNAEKLGSVDFYQSVRITEAQLRQHCQQNPGAKLVLALQELKAIPPAEVPKP